MRPFVALWLQRRKRPKKKLREMNEKDDGTACASVAFDPSVRNRTLTLIEREDDTRSWGNFLVYFSYSTTMPCPPRGWGYILIGC
jgi:hypothetical protein